MKVNSLLSISPIDGRYINETEELREYFSEFAYLKYRTLAEINYIIFLSDFKIIRKIKSSEKILLYDISENFSTKDGTRIKNIENKTKHDVKAIEYFIKERLEKTSLKDISSYVHLGLTSEDVNNIAIRLMLKNANKKILLREIKKLNNFIYKNYKKYKKLPMLARTHGQAAVPTTLGKEFFVFYKRIEAEIKYLERIKFKAKLNGAIGNYNALFFIYPKTNWEKFTKQYLKSFKLETNLVTNQVAPSEDVIFFFQTIQRINGIVLDLNQDMWRYISDGYFSQNVIKNEVGSSTMPQKVNPIYFENSEGNIIIANSLIDGFTNKLPVSRLQRDLSGSTISRNFGTTIAHSLLAYKNTSKGLLRTVANKDKILFELNSDWTILTEAVQAYLRKEGISEGYEIIKKNTRGKKLTKKDYQKLINDLPLNKKQKNELEKLTPSKYTGI